jgi:hypothetical protein
MADHSAQYELLLNALRAADTREDPFKRPPDAAEEARKRESLKQYEELLQRLRDASSAPYPGPK